MTATYQEFLAAKAQLATTSGLEVDPVAVHPVLMPHQRDIVTWAVAGGRRAIFASFGLGKSIIQLETLRLLLEQRGGRGLIVCPLGVRQEFTRDARLLDLEPRFIRTAGEASPSGIHLTNYESIREGKLDPRGFDVVSLDEAAILRGFGGTKTFRELMRLYEGTAAYRFVATATPSPNEHLELLAYAAFLDVMDVGQAKTRFFRRDSEHADRLTLHPHMEEEFWLWVASWAMFVTKPSDLGHDDTGYELPPLDVRWHEVKSLGSGEPDIRRDGQAALWRDASLGVQAAAAEKRESIAVRVALVMELIADGREGAQPASPADRGLQGVPARVSARVLPPPEGRDHARAEGGASDVPAGVPAKEPRDAAAGEADPRTATALWPDRGAVRPDDGGARLGVRDLHPAAGGPAGRSRPHDGEGAGLALSQMQHRDRPTGGQPRPADEGRRLRSDQVVVWCDLNDEQRAIERALRSAGISYSSLYGNQTVEEREDLLAEWRAGKTRVFLSKPLMYGAGVNLQQCNRMVFAGVTFKFNEVIQAIHRIYRFLQERPVRIDLIYTEAERGIRANLERKWAQHVELVARMGEIIRRYGLSHEAMSQTLHRSIGVRRREVSGDGYRLVNADAVEETAAMSDSSVDLIVTSIPFCYDEATEILTRHGWLTFDRVSMDEDVATVHPIDLCIEWQRPTRRVWEHYDGEMLHFTGRSFDHMVTPNHRMFAARRGAGFDPSQLHLVEADAIAQTYEHAQRRTQADGRVLRGWRTCLVPPRRGDGKRPEAIAIPPLPPEIRTGHGVQLYWVETEDFMRLAGWYLAEGHADSFKTGRSGGRISIAQTAVNQPFRDEIEELFVRIGLPPSMHEKQLSVWCRNLARFLQRDFGHGAAEKRIPAWVKELHPDLLEILRDTMMKGDGSKALNSYASISPRLRDDFQEICLATGWRAALTDGKAVNLGQSQLFPEIRHAPQRVAYSGMIGCLTVPNHTLIVRRNGKAFVSGNSTQYEYTPSYNDFGHSEDNEHFWQQMDYLTPELLRVLRPGRVAAIHVKDRVVPGGMTGLGFQTVQPFHAEAITHYQRHGLAFLGMKTIVTDVVRENNQTYRLGWTEQCKDGTRMGAGLPEYLLLFRRPPTDSSNGYADDPVVKSKEAYTRTRWQIDAHGFARSNGNRPLLPEELADLPHDSIFRRFRDHYLEHVYDFEQHVALGEELEQAGRLPTGFMLLQTPSWHPDVWTDVARMRTLNMMQQRKGQQYHLCPMPFDIVDRLIVQFSQSGETVFDPFGGLMTVPYCAVKLGRVGWGIELNPGYFADGVAYVESVAAEASVPTLFDLAEVTG